MASSAASSGMSVDLLAVVPLRGALPGGGHRLGVRVGGRLAGDQNRIEADLAMVMIIGSLDLVDEQLGRGRAQVDAGLAYRRQRHGGGAGELDVVVADDGQLLGDRDVVAQRVL